MTTSVNINANGDLIVDVAATFKSRTERLEIDNTDPDNKLVILHQSLRTVQEDGKTGTKPLVKYAHSFTIPELMDYTWNGITFMHVFGFIQAWATEHNIADAQVMVDMLLPPVSTPSIEEPLTDGYGSAE